MQIQAFLPFRNMAGNKWNKSSCLRYVCDAYLSYDSLRGILKNNGIPEVMICTIKFKYYFHQIISFCHVLYFTVNWTNCVSIAQLLVYYQYNKIIYINSTPHIHLLKVGGGWEGRKGVNITLITISVRVGAWFMWIWLCFFHYNPDFSVNSGAAYIISRDKEKIAR